MYNMCVCVCVCETPMLITIYIMNNFNLLSKDKTLFVILVCQLKKMLV